MSKLYTLTAFMLCTTDAIDELVKDLRTRKVSQLVIDLKAVYPVTVNTPVDVPTVTHNMGLFLDKFLPGNFDIQAIALLTPNDARARPQPVIDRLREGTAVAIFSMAVTGLLLFLPILIAQLFFKDHTAQIDTGGVILDLLAGLTGAIVGAIWGMGASLECRAFNNKMQCILSEKQQASQPISSLGLDQLRGNAYLKELSIRQQKYHATAPLTATPSAMRYSNPGVNQNHTAGAPQLQNTATPAYPTYL